MSEGGRAPGKALLCALTTWFLDMERAFLRSASVVPEDAEGGLPAAAAPEGDEPGGALIVTDTCMLILSEGSALALDGDRSLVEGEDDEDPASSPLSLTQKANSQAEQTHQAEMGKIVSLDHIISEFLPF